MYSVYDYGWMIADKVRTDAYYRALSENIKEGAVVVDIGTGLGIWALMACKLGARKVYAIEASGVIELARQIAVDNGYDSRIEFIHDLSTNVDLPEQADLVVAEVHGVLPLFEQSLVSLIDARRRFLKPDGVLIPRAETIGMSIVEDAKSYQHFYDAWDEHNYGFNMEAARRFATHECRKANFRLDQLLSDPVVQAVLDYSRLETPNVVVQAECVVSRAGTAHGLGVWFDSDLSVGSSFSNAPGNPPLIFGNLFFPFAEPVSVSKSDRVSSMLRGDLVGQAYVWTWNTKIFRQGARSEPLVFRQSTFHGDLHGPNQLRKSSASHVPRLNDDGLAERFILERMNGDLSLEAIANELRVRLPRRFLTFQESLNYVAQTSKRYSQ